MKNPTITGSEASAEFIDLSADLRNYLLSKIDELYEKKHLVWYLKNSQDACKACNEGQFIAYITGHKAHSRVFALSAANAVETWNGMHRDHRIAVLAKFKTYCIKLMAKVGPVSGINLSAAFCSVFLIELTGILNEGTMENDSP